MNEKSRPGRRRHRTRLALAGLTLLAVFPAGCGLFDVREPFEPVGNIPRHIPNDPDSVLFNFQIGWQYRTTGVSQISEAMGPTFVIRLDPADVIRTGIDSLGKADVELGIRSFLKSRVKGNQVRITFNTGAEDFQRLPQGDRILYDNLPYLMELYATGGTVVERIAGVVDLIFGEQSDNNWAMIDWKDSGGDDPAETYGYYIGLYSGVSFQEPWQPDEK